MDMRYLCGKTVNICDDIFQLSGIEGLFMHVCRYWNISMDIDEDILALIHRRNEQYDITVVHEEIPTICSL